MVTNVLVVPLNIKIIYRKFKYLVGVRLRSNWGSIEQESNAERDIKIIFAQRLTRMNGQPKKMKL